jgi:hypothetical protein
MSEYDQRQYRRMLERLEWIEEGEFSSSLATDLSVLLGALEAREAEWERNFQNGLGGLDEDISVAVFRWEEEGEPASKDISFDEETVKRMRETVAKLKQLVLRKIEPPADDAEDAN